MRNWKTTLGALIVIVTYLLSEFGIELPPNIQSALFMLGVGIWGYFTEDKKKGFFKRQMEHSQEVIDK